MNNRLSLIATSVSVTLALSPLITSASAQTPAAKFVDSARVEIEKATDTHDRVRLDNAIVLLDRALVAFPNDPYLLHYRGYARYHQVINLFDAGKTADATPFIDRGVADLQQSSNQLQWAETWSLLYSLNAFKLAIDPTLGMTLGAELSELDEKARALGANNPRVLLIEGIGAARTPPEYGGGVDKARALLTRSIAAFDTYKPSALAPTWGREQAVEFKKQLDKPGE